MINNEKLNKMVRSCGLDSGKSVAGYDRPQNMTASGIVGVVEAMRTRLNVLNSGMYVF